MTWWLWLACFSGDGVVSRPAAVLEASRIGDTTRYGNDAISESWGGGEGVWLEDGPVAFDAPRGHLTASLHADRETTVEVRLDGDVLSRVARNPPTR
jgi:hypothetical protein